MIRYEGSGIKDVLEEIERLGEKRHDSLVVKDGDSVKIATRSKDGTWTVDFGELYVGEPPSFRLPNIEELVVDTRSIKWYECWTTPIGHGYDLDVKWLCEKLEIPLSSYNISLWTAELAIEWCTKKSEDEYEHQYDAWILRESLLMHDGRVSYT